MSIAQVGIYRVNGSAVDMGRLKRAFESNPYEAEQLLKECDIHAVAGILKQYLRYTSFKRALTDFNFVFFQRAA